MTFLFSVLTSLAMLQTASSGARHDSCSELLPKNVHSAIARSYPGYRLVRESDYDAETIASERQYHDGSPCLGLASTDVNGDGRHDVVFLLASKTGKTLVVAALTTGNRHWKLSTLDRFSGTPRGYFVNTLDAGRYVDMYDVDDASDEWRPEPGRIRRYMSRRAGFCAGSIEASEIAYFYTGTRWVHLWLSD
jgi:hypothetical protein